MKTLLLMAGVLTTATLAAQQAPSAPAGAPAPAFEVASVKRNASGDGFVSGSLSPGRPTFTNVPVRQLQPGLKLESTKGPVEIIVIDSVAPPTED